eukprot:TRINITY_DN7189_c0_g1_i1.p1 TRINITY_DN7189_c0_g1~~TRINITY_DN7189_c0_g1_i1.p1  ORF type:complete len:237 (-),score=56.46 TRINITY_DN7189_c0_g1_i1:268-978(-)
MERAPPQSPVARAAFERMRAWPNDKARACDAMRRRCLARVAAARDSRVAASRAAATVAGTATATATSAAGTAASPEVQLIERTEIRRAVEAVLSQGVVDGSVTSEEEYQEMMTLLEASLLEDIKDDKLVSQYLDFESQELAATVECHLGEGSVICPVCKHSKLLKNSNIVSCQCGMHVNLKTDSVTLTQIGELLCSAVGAHSSVCDAEPSFAVKKVGEEEMLVMSCTKCSKLSIIV